MSKTALPVRAAKAAAAMLLALTAAACVTEKAALDKGAPSDLSPESIDVPVASALKLEALDGYEAPLAAEFPNAAGLVVFFATYCVPFVEMIPYLNDLSDKLGEEGKYLVAASMDMQPKQMLAPFTQEFQVSFTVLVAGAKMRATGVSPIGKITEIPAVWIIDKNGSLQFAKEGVKNVEELDGYAKKYLLVK